MVSNHGGHALQGTAGSIDMLPSIADAVGDRLEVYFDGGVRRGTDVLKALALGARATFVGRPIFWGLSVAGEDGVRHCIENSAPGIESGHGPVRCDRRPQG